MGQIGAPATFYLTSKFAVQAMLWLLVFFCQTPYYDELERRQAWEQGHTAMYLKMRT